MEFFIIVMGWIATAIVAIGLICGLYFWISSIISEIRLNRYEKIRQEVTRDIGNSMRSNAYYITQDMVMYDVLDYAGKYLTDMSYFPSGELLRNRLNRSLKERHDENTEQVEVRD